MQKWNGKPNFFLVVGELTKYQFLSFVSFKNIF
jgi:hypothetical protein